MRSRRKCGRKFKAAIGWFLITVLCAGVTTGLGAQKVSFPGARSGAESPDGRFSIKNSDNDLHDPAHSLTLVDHQNGSVINIYQYERGVDVLWSPASNAFVINDHEGSNVSHPVLFREPWSTNYTDLRAQLIDYLGSANEAKSVLDNHHVYFTAQRWLSNKQILCELTGYGDVDPKGFTKHYVYKLGAGFRPYH